MYTINGRFVVRDFGGQERYSFEIIAELDKIAEMGEFELVVPAYAENIPTYKNIPVVKYGNIKGHFWEQTNFWWYLIKNKRTGVNPCITCSIQKPDIVTLHDIGQLINNSVYKNLYGKLSRQWHKLMFISAARKSPLILTVSNYSKNEIIKHLNVEPERIIVTGNGWQHFERIVVDDTLFDRHRELKKGQYYLSASSLTPQKNFKWVQEAAKLNPNCIFAIAGKKVNLSQDKISEDLPNLYYLGYVTDGEMKSLMKHCKAFIHPAKYEGFGLTPLEAMSVGAPIVISNATCLPEVYGDSAHYIDPDIPNVDLDKILQEPVGDSQTILEKYSWARMAQIMYDAIKFHC